MFWSRHRDAAAKGANKRDPDLYFQAFEHASIPTLICDTTGCILEVNAAFTALLGYNSEELIDKRVSEITHPDDLEGHHGRMTMLLSGEKETMRTEKRYVKKDGTTVWGSISVAVPKGRDGRPAFLISQIRDITAERRTREKLVESEGRLQAILDNSDAVIYAKDLHGHYILVNRKYEDLFAIKRDRIIGRTDHELFSGPMADTFAANDRQVAEAGKGLQFEEDVVTPNEVHTYVSAKFPLRNIRGKIVAVCGISTDITERKMSERQMRELNERLLKTNEELKAVQMQLIQMEKLESVGRLAAGVAHEVKNPLALLQLGVDYLDDAVPKEEDPNVGIILQDMREAITRAEKIVHGMVDFSADRQLNLQMLDINGVIRGAQTLVKHQMTLNNIDLWNEFSANLPPVLVDQVKIEQVFVNVFMNAIQAMAPDKRGALTVRTSLRALAPQERDAGSRTSDHLRGGDAVVAIEIQDTGPGIPESVFSKIFDPFFTTKATGDGTGLGLSVVKKIIELHKGVVKVENAPGGGAAVTLILRAQPPSAEVPPKSSNTTQT
ncbi:MAG: PAS domain S-box protein [Verrucomicrobiales bacterium]|nr:PAS domain S-box protein [Verrucomicrobiales bacterium]